MSRRSTVEDWRRAVYRAARLSGNVQVLLLRMADHMRADRRVSVPRSQLAQELGVHEQRVAERIRVGIEAGFLDKTGGGYRGRTAEYQGLFPGEQGAERVRATSTHSTPETRTHSTNECVLDGEYATTRAEPSREVENRNGGNDQEHVPTGVSMPPVVCRWHPNEPCPSDCANAPTPETSRRRTA